MPCHSVEEGNPECEGCGEDVRDEGESVLGCGVCLDRKSWRPFVILLLRCQIFLERLILLLSFIAGFIISFSSICTRAHPIEFVPKSSPNMFLIFFVFYLVVTIIFSNFAFDMIYQLFTIRIIPLWKQTGRGNSPSSFIVVGTDLHGEKMWNVFVGKNTVLHSLPCYRRAFGCKDRCFSFISQANWPHS